MRRIHTLWTEWVALYRFLRRHLPAWRAAVRTAGRNSSLGAMLRALLSGPVPAEIWRARMRVCLKCPVLVREGMTCGRPGAGIGCACFVPFKAMTAAPYTEGCWARAIGMTTEGWPAYKRITRKG